MRRGTRLAVFSRKQTVTPSIQMVAMMMCSRFVPYQSPEDERIRHAALVVQAIAAKNRGDTEINPLRHFGEEDFECAVQTAQAYQINEDMVRDACLRILPDDAPWRQTNSV
jgi:hypothetical protein